jgi:histidinol-phosphate phosphatase family protein
MASQLEILLSWNIDRSWALFLDRDGVINRRIMGGYVIIPDEFEFLPGVLTALKTAAKLFNRIIVVTNQQGVGKGLMTEKQLQEVHDYMIEKIKEAGGRIDKIYVSTHLEAENNPMRKPNPGMAFQAKKDFPDIVLSKSIMIGDTENDMIFARNAKMKAVFIGNPLEIELPRQLYDVFYPSLKDFMDDVKSVIQK